MVLIRSHDALFRFVFGDPATLGELLRAQLPTQVAAAIDWASLRPVDGAFVDEVLQERRTDLLFEVRLQGGPAMLHVLCDHKSSPEHFTALQLTRYAVRILDRWLASNPEAHHLPPVLTVVVHHGDRSWSAPRNLDQLYDLDATGGSLGAFLRPTLLHNSFVLIDVATMDEATIDAMRLSAVGALTLRFLQFLRRSDPAQAADWIVRWQWLVGELLQEARGRAVIVALFSWFLSGAKDSHETLRTVMNRIDEENRPMRSALDLLLDMGHERGLKQGLEQGLEQGLDLLRGLLAAQLRARFGEPEGHVLAQLAEADGPTLHAIGERLATAERLDDVFPG